MNKTPRNYGIDLLRILSMLGVVLLHVMNHGGILGIAQSPAKFSLVWFLEVLAYPAVNCFVLISGYVGYRGEKLYPRLKSLLSLMFTVVFYNFAFYALFTLLRPETFTLKELFLNLFPTYGNKYWFFTTYFGLFLLSPMLNLLVYRSDRKLALLFFLVLGLFTAVSIHRGNFFLMDGYSVLWFVFMYLAGALIRKYALETRISGKLCGIVISASFAVTWLSRVLLHFAASPALQQHSGHLVNYVSPTVVLLAMGLLILFSRVKLSARACALVSFLASSAFSVYLIHDNYYVRIYLISNIHKIAGNFPAALLGVYILACAAVIFVCCILGDKIRIRIFDLLRIHKLAERLEECCTGVFGKICSRMEQKIEE